MKRVPVKTSRRGVYRGRTVYCGSQLV